MSPYQTQKVLSAKRHSEEEAWEYLETGCLKKSHSACVCMTCQHFSYACDQHSRTFIACRIKERLIPHGEHLNSRCPRWMRSTEKEIGCYREAA